MIFYKSSKLKMAKKNFNMNIIYVLFPFIIILSKIVRYTLMKNVLVDFGIGHNWLFFINSNMSADEILSYSIASGANGVSILIYRMINFFNLDNYVHFEIYISIIFNILLFFLIFSGRKKYLSFFDFIFIIVSIAVLNLFDFTLAKEPIQMLFFYLMYFVLEIKYESKHKKIFYISLILLLASFTFRIYYLLILAYTLITYFFFDKFLKNKKVIKKKYILAFVLSIGMIYFIILTVLKNFSYDNYLELLRVRTREADAVTQIDNIFDSSNLILFSVNYILMFVRMLFPIELVTLGPKYIMYILYQIMITIYVFKNILNLKKNRDSINIAIYLFVGFLFGSATFEPDFGSWIRHEAVLFPIFYFIIKDNSKTKVVDCIERKYKNISDCSNIQL